MPDQNPSKPKAKKPKKPKKGQWMNRFRDWHTKLGVLLAAVIVLVCLTGIYLNHKDFFEGKDEDKPIPHAGPDAAGLVRVGDSEGPMTPPALTTRTPLEDVPISFNQAMRIAREQLGEGVALEKIELKNEHGRLEYKIKTDKHVPGAGDRELVIDARNGEAKLKDKGEGYAEYTISADGEKTAGYDWGKIIKDLHTGEIGGEAGKLFIDITSLVIIGLTLTGVYLWAVPKMRRAKSKKKAAAAKTAATT